MPGWAQDMRAQDLPSGKCLVYVSVGEGGRALGKSPFYPGEILRLDGTEPADDLLCPRECCLSEALGNQALAGDLRTGQGVQIALAGSPGW
jgi:hypothetical protein